MLVILGSAVPGPSIPHPHPCGQGEKRGTESHDSMSRPWDQHPATSPFIAAQDPPNPHFIPGRHRRTSARPPQEQPGWAMGWEGLKESGSGAGSAFCPLVTGLWESAAGSQVSAGGQETLSKAEQCRELPCSTRQPSHEGRKEFASSPQRQFQEQLHVLDTGSECEQSPA